MIDKSNKDVLGAEPALYAVFTRVGSKEARSNFPVLVDTVVDTGEPVILTKLGRARAALIPARDLVFHQMFQDLGMTGRNNINRPVHELVVELHDRLKRRLAPRDELTAG